MHQIASSLWKPKPQYRLVLRPRNHPMNIHATPPNCFYPRQQPQPFLTWKGKGRRYKGTSILPPTPLPPYPQTGGYSHCRCLKPSRHSKPSLPWLGTPQRSPGEAPIPPAGSELNHQHRGGRSTWCTIHPRTIPPAAGIEAERVSGTQHGGDGALPTSVNAAFLTHH